MAEQHNVSKDKNISFKIDPELHKAFRLRCFEGNTNIKRALLDFIEKEARAFKASGKHLR